VGYHNEHHDLPSIPWNHLPEVRQAAPELYNSLVFHTSWTKLLFRFLFDPNITLFSRQVRISRGGVALNAAVKPDVEFLEDEQTASRPSIFSSKDEPENRRLGRRSRGSFRVSFVLRADRREARGSSNVVLVLPS
jgi:hypothetical protein